MCREHKDNLQIEKKKNVLANHISDKGLESKYTETFQKSIVNENKTKKLCNWKKGKSHRDFSLKSIYR